ncbi:hypothetical protein AMTRI_Chr01g109840 [Amborella trichopoda]
MTWIDLLLWKLNTHILCGVGSPNPLREGTIPWKIFATIITRGGEKKASGSRVEERREEESKFCGRGNIFRRLENVGIEIPDF